MENDINIIKNHPNKLEIPKIEKQLGDEKRNEKNYKEAIIHYKNAIVALKIIFDDEHNTLQEDEQKATQLIEDVGIPVHLNLAYCFLELGDWKSVILYCNKVLELNPKHIKAIYRRCKAFMNLGDVNILLN
jgi:tetratricopeptide (TPR) repeat protein